MGKISSALLGALLPCLLAATATAEQPSVRISRFVTRDHQQNAGKVLVTQISREDCLTDDRIGFRLELQRFEGYALELWAGQACDTQNARHSTTPTCWKLTDAQPQSETFEVFIGVRDLLSGRTNGEATGNGTSSNVPACKSAVRGAQILTMYALLLDANESTAASTTWQSTYRLDPPPPPGVVSVQSGDRQVSVEISPLVADQTFNGVELFCDPAPNDPNAATNAETTIDDAGVSVAACPPSTELIPGADAASLQHLHCGSASKTTLTAVADGLVNGVSYNIAVASVDTYGNVGPLSGIACQVPQARESDLRAQACSFSGTARKRHDSALFWLVGLGAVLAHRCLDRHRRRTTAGNGTTSNDQHAAIGSGATQESGGPGSRSDAGGQAGLSSGGALLSA